MKTEPVHSSDFDRRHFLQLLGGSLLWLGAARGAQQADRLPPVPASGALLGADKRRSEALAVDAEGMSDPGWSY